MCLIGCKPEGRHIEQHDIFFGIAGTAAELVGQMEAFWPDGGRLHLDAWRKVSCVNGIRVEVRERSGSMPGGRRPPGYQLYFINLGGYQARTFEELHYKLITVQPDKAGAIQAAKASGFYQKANGSHVDDQYGVDIDDLYNVEDILPVALKNKYALWFSELPQSGEREDDWRIGYTKMEHLERAF